MNAVTADFSKTNGRRVSRKLVLALRALADYFETRAAEKAQARQRLEDTRSIACLIDKYEVMQPNLATELRFIASRN
jgi:hypothetical protein